MGDALGIAGAEEQKRRKIVMAVDESEESMYALKWCLNNIILRSPPNSQDALIIIHAKRPTVVYPGFESEYVFSHDALSSLDKHDREVANLVLERAHIICLEHNVEEVGKMVEGDPRDVICEMVKVLKADLLVMGSHGYGRFVRAMLGSVSNHCVQNAGCPVLVVKTPKPDA